MGYFIWFWTHMFRQVCHILWNRKQQTRKAYEYLDQLEAAFQGSFRADSRREIAQAHGVFQPMVVDAFCRLQGYRPDRDHIERQILYFCMSTLFDDFTDSSDTPEDVLLDMMHGKDPVGRGSFEARVLMHSHQWLIRQVRKQVSYLDTLETLFNAQMRSRQQTMHSLDKQALEQITLTKGGLSTYLCAFYLEKEPSEAEARCWKLIGQVIQLTDDMYDVEQDLLEGTQTLVTRLRAIGELKTLFMQQVHAMRTAVREIPASRRRKREFSMSMAGIYAFGLVALEQFGRLQGDQPRMPSWMELRHKDMIVDMEKPANIWRWIRYVYRFARLV